MTGQARGRDFSETVSFKNLVSKNRLAFSDVSPWQAVGWVSTAVGIDKPQQIKLTEVHIHPSSCTGWYKHGKNANTSLRKTIYPGKGLKKNIKGRGGGRLVRWFRHWMNSHQARPPEFDTREPHSRRRELIPTSCPLTARPTHKQ